MGDYQAKLWKDCLKTKVGNDEKQERANNCELGYWQHYLRTVHQQQQ